VEHAEIYKSVFECFGSVAEISDEEKRGFIESTEIRLYKKGEVYVRQGEVPRSIGFIYSGLMRKFYLSPDGREFTKLFCVEKQFVAAFASFLSREESYFSVEALEDSTVVNLSYDYFKAGIERDVCWLKLYNRAIESFYLIKEKREGQLLTENAKSRYIRFLEEYPGLEDRVKQYQVASYLGITPVSLSRIRSEMKE